MSKIVEKLRSEIGDSGVISFARFMELALYCPVYGYYEKEEDTIGCRGDFYTSASVGPLFGALLGAQFSQWLDRLLQFRQSLGGSNGSQPVVIIEVGAHRGEICRDVLNWMREHRPDRYDSLHYWILEPSARRRAWQEHNLVQHLGKVIWFGDFQSCPQIPIYGVIFANELLDALPVHRLGWDARAKSWFEWGVTLECGEFIWARMEGGGKGQSVLEGLGNTPATRFLRELPPEVVVALPDGYSLEVSPAACLVWEQAARLLSRGWLMTFDYGYELHQALAPERSSGTLRGYRRHQQVKSILASPGEQDITAHVNFGAIQAVGELAGLRTEVFASQEQFLTRIAARVWDGSVPFPAWTDRTTREFRTLTHPAQLGRSFSVLVQVKGFVGQE